MFTHILIDNLEGISNKIELDLISKSRNKNQQNSVYQTKDGIYINKMIGIIGSNGSGKSSIILAIGMIGHYISYSMEDQNIDAKLELLDKLIDDKEIKNEIYSDLLSSIKRGPNLSKPNVRRDTEDTKIEVELYIPNKEENLEGYYTYELSYNYKNKNITYERLYYRNKYKSKSKLIVDIMNNNVSQVGYIVKFYNNISDIKAEESLSEKYKYCKTFLEHYLFNSKLIRTSEVYNMRPTRMLDWYRSDPEIVKKIINMVDPKIVDIREDKEDQELNYIFKDGSKIYFDMLSTGTIRFLSLIMNVLNVVKTKGVMVIDEIELNLHIELIEFILKVFSECNNSQSQLLFTTNLSNIFDFKTHSEKNIFKHDCIYILKTVDSNINIEKLLDIRYKGKRIKGNAVVENLYRNKIISCHPNKESIDDFIEKMAGQTVQEN